MKTLVRFALLAVAFLPCLAVAQPAPAGNTASPPGATASASIPPAAAPANVTHPASTAPPPPSGLGQQVEGPGGEIVLPKPSPSEIAEDTLGAIEELQLTPEQWATLKRLNEARQREAATPYVTAPKPVTRTMMLNLDPGVSPPVVRLSRGQLSSIVFSDAGGHPWYIDAVSLNTKAFRNARDKKENEDSGDSNILTIEPLALASYGNVTVNLRGLATPVIFILTAGQNEVDMRVDAKIPGNNPTAPPDVAITGLPSLDEALGGFLDGVPPSGARRLHVTGLAGAEAWMFQENLYLRARADVAYPAFLASARSTSGVSVYRFAGAHRAVTMLTGGQAVTAFMEDTK